MQWMVPPLQILLRAYEIGTPFFLLIDWTISNGTTLEVMGPFSEITCEVMGPFNENMLGIVKGTYFI
jgi:hypothetical protein